MARTKSKFKPIKITFTVIEPTRKALELLVETGGYGNSPPDAAREIVMEHLRRLERRRKIKLFPDTADGQKPTGNGDKK